jgi:hypothetical protein
MGQVRAHIEAGAFRWLAQDSEIFLRIRHVYQKLPATVFLRAADTIHLATAAESEFRIVYSNDAHLLGAAKYFGIEGRKCDWQSDLNMCLRMVDLASMVE